MSPIVQIFAIVLGIGIIAFAFKALRRRTLSEIQTGLWLLAGFIAVILGAFPSIIMWTAEQLGITWPPAIMLLLAIVGLGLIVFGRTQEINALNSRQIELTEQLSITRYELEKLTNRVQELEGGGSADFKTDKDSQE